MPMKEYDLSAYQLLHYLVTRYGYQVVRVEQHKDDLWVMNAAAKQYPIIRICQKQEVDVREDHAYVRNVHELISQLIHRESTMLIFNTDPQSTPMQDSYMTQIQVLDQQVSDPSILKIFQGLDQVIHPVDDQLAEMAQLSKEIEEAQLKQQKDMLQRMKRNAQPRLTIVLMAICMAMMLLQLIMTLLTGDVLSGSYASGAYYKMSVVAAHEYWRLFTAIFVHTDILHLFVNLYALYAVGKLCERCYHHKGYLMIFLLSGVIGNAVVLIASPNGFAMGISASVLGLFTAFLTTQWLQKTLRHPLIRMALFHAVWGCLLAAFMPGVSLLGNIAGAVCGSLCALLLYAKRKDRQLFHHAMTAFALLLITVGYMIACTTSVQPIDRGVDHQIVQIYEHTPLQGYGEYLKNRYEKQYQREVAL